ncbi:MAG: hypothetical protein MJ245_05790 [Clostridia bacterium]|nr:hypothetical protein [Clostridia bacterium]
MNYIDRMFQGIDSLFSFRGILLLLSLVAVVTSFCLIAKYISTYLVYKKNKMKYLIKKGNRSVLKDITDMLMKNRSIAKGLRFIALKIGMVSKYTYEKNLEIGVALIGGAMVVSLIVIFTIVPSSNMVWYELVYYLLIAGIMIALIVYMFFSTVRSSFISKLPDVYKILNSRYISQGNILKAIDMSLDDFDKVIRKEMMKIYNILKKNDMNEINDAFKEIEKTYNTEYLTILLSLIKQAHFKGGNDMIKEQFETITEEILQEIENQNDLSSASKSYIVMAIFVPPVMKYIESFNAGAIGPDAADFYVSSAGKTIFMVTLVAMFAYMGLMIFLERSV